MFLETTWMKTQMKKIDTTNKDKNQIEQKKKKRKKGKPIRKKMKQPYISVSNRSNKHDLI